MTELLHLSPKLIGETLTRLGIRWIRTPEDLFLARFNIGPNPSLTVAYRADSKVDDEPSILSIYAATTPADLDLDLVPMLIGLANRWNLEHRWPKAHVEASGEILSEIFFPLATRTHRNQITELLAVATDTQLVCHNWLADHRPQPATPTTEILSAAELETWYHRHP